MDLGSPLVNPHGSWPDAKTAKNIVTVTKTIATPRSKVIAAAVRTTRRESSSSVIDILYITNWT